MGFSTLVSASELADRLGDPSIVLVDVRSSLADPEYGARVYREGHIPGAVYADLNRDLSDPPGNGRGRHPLPEVQSMAKTFGNLGISRDKQVFVYDDSDGMYASRLWWMLRYLGHERVAVLDGGIASWRSANGAVSTETASPEPAVFVPDPVRDRLATSADVEAMRSDANRILVDSRAPDRFRGENETIDPVAGHIPGARNRFFRWNVREDGTFRPSDELAAELRELLGGVAPGDAVFYCGSGVTACHNLLAMAHAGLDEPRLYGGSWSEWISDPERPVAVGPDSAE